MINIARIGVCKLGLKGVLILEDGSIYYGCGFGAKGIVIGEVVFTTSMVGYPESLTDPSYHGQILIITHPLIGNYGVASKKLAFKGVPLHFESDRIWVRGLIISELTNSSHWSSIMSLHEWLLENNVPGLYRVDTRALVKKIREKGVMMGILAVFDEDDNIDTEKLYDVLRKAPRYDDIPFAYEVAPKEIIEHGDGKITIGIVDCGVKYGIVRELLYRGCKVIRYPPWTKPEKIVNECNGVIISNGPGNPAILTEVIKNVQALIEYEIPILGICIGNEYIAKIFGGKITSDIPDPLIKEKIPLSVQYLIISIRFLCSRGSPRKDNET